MNKKRLISVLLVFTLLLPSVSFSESEYSPKLNMTMQDFVDRYNMIGAPFGSSLHGLGTPYEWTIWNEYKVAWFNTDSKSGVTILLESSDPLSSAKTTSAGVDRVQIYMIGTEDFLSFVSVCSRCLSLLAPNIYGLDMSYYYLAQIMRDYYENNCMERGLSYQRQLVDDGKIYIRFFNDSGYYYFEIVEESDL